MKRAYAYARLTGLPRERERGGDLCVATDALKNARVRDVNDTLYRGGGRGGRGQGSQTPVSLIGDASRNRSVEFDISVQSSATDPPPRLIYAFPLSFVPSCFDVHACAVK